MEIVISIALGLAISMSSLIAIYVINKDIKKAESEETNENINSVKEDN